MPGLQREVAQDNLKNNDGGLWCISVGSVDIIDDPAAAANMNTEPLQTWEVRRQCILYSKKSKAFWCKACRVQWVLCE